MKLSDKYVVKEDTMNITLYSLVERDVLDDKKNPTGETKIVEKLEGSFSTSSVGRSQLYSRLINCEISSLEKQTLQEILDTVKRCEEQVIEFWEKQ